MSTRSKAAQGRNQTREVLESPAFRRGEHVNGVTIYGAKTGVSTTKYFMFVVDSLLAQ